jgi:hypothetical protein
VRISAGSEPASRDVSVAQLDNALWVKSVPEEHSCTTEPRHGAPRSSLLRLSLIATSHELAGLMGLRLAAVQIAAAAFALSCGSAHQNHRKVRVCVEQQGHSICSATSRA